MKKTSLYVDILFKDFGSWCFKFIIASFSSLTN